MVVAEYILKVCSYMENNHPTLVRNISLIINENPNIQSRRVGIRLGNRAVTMHMTHRDFMDLCEVIDNVGYNDDVKAKVTIRSVEGKVYKLTIRKSVSMFLGHPVVEIIWNGGNKLRLDYDYISGEVVFI